MAAIRKKSRAAVPTRRGGAFVSSVLGTTLECLASAGFQQLSIPEVASLLGVNKTSIYRRWPTKGALVADALQAAMGGAGTFVSLGSLHADVVALASRSAAFVESALGRATLRMLLAEGSNAEVHALAQDAMNRGSAWPRAVFDKARARGELRAGANLSLATTVIAGALMHRTLVEQAPLTQDFIHDVVTLALSPVLRRGA